MAVPGARWTPVWFLVGLALPFLAAAVAILAGRLTGLFAVGFFVWLGLLPALPVAVSGSAARTRALGWGVAGSALAYGIQVWIIARAVSGDPIAL